MSKMSGFEAVVLAFIAADGSDAEWRRCYATAYTLLGGSGTLDAVAEAYRRIRSGMADTAPHEDEEYASESIYGGEG